MFLQVMAVDQESGDAAFAIVVVEVLAEGQLGTETPSRPDSGRFQLGVDKLSVSVNCSSL